MYFGANPSSRRARRVSLPSSDLLLPVGQFTPQRCAVVLRSRTDHYFPLAVLATMLIVLG
jgi:hypothetical protein